MNETILYNEMLTDVMIHEFLQEWLLQIVTAISVFYLIKMSKTRRKVEQLTMIKVDSIAYALGKTSVGDDFTKHYEYEVEKRMKHENFKDS